MDNKIKNKVSEFFDKYNLWDKTVLVGFSGGFDSMCLLNLLADINKSDDYPKIKNIIACHYNHNWRGEKAVLEQNNCKEFCEKLGVEFYTETAPDNIKKNETEARELRYSFFDNCLDKYRAKYNNEAVLLTAHNFDDNAETILYRIIKGTGIVGLQGILPKRENFYRPLITIKRAEIEHYCKTHQLKPNNDDSNNDRIHKRNLIRHDILPLLEQINPEVKTALNTLGEIAISETDIVNEYITTLETDLFDGETIKTPQFLKLSKQVRQKVIYNLIYNSKYDYSMDTITNISEFIDRTLTENKPSKMSLGNDGWVYADSNIIEIITETAKPTEIIKLENSSNGKYKLGEVVFEIKEAEEYTKTEDESTAFVDLSGFKELYIRTRRDGDIIQPLGSEGKMKLKKYLMSKKIPQHKRDGLVLLTDGAEILWVGGVGMSDKIKVTTKPTNVLRVKGTKILGH